MQDNFTYDEMMEQLIRYLDGELSEEEKTAVEKLLQQDNTVRDRYENLLVAKDTVKAHGLRNRVQVMHNEYMAAANENAAEKRQQAKIIRPDFTKKYTSILRIAAVMLIAVVSYGIYEYSTTDNNTIYGQNFISYHLPVTRGGNIQVNVLDSFYSAKNYDAAINTFKTSTPKTQKDYFIAALSFLELNNAKEAIDAFTQLQQLNNNNAEKYFVEETEYYLALAYLKAGKTDDAIKLLDKITGNKQHMYYQKANEISRLKLTFLKWKE